MFAEDVRYCRHGFLKVSVRLLPWHHSALYGFHEAGLVSAHLDAAASA
ncbi:hypothetical protein [Roseiarcus sp.]